MYKFFGMPHETNKPIPETGWIRQGRSAEDGGEGGNDTGPYIMVRAHEAGRHGMGTIRVPGLRRGDVPGGIQSPGAPPGSLAQTGRDRNGSLRRSNSHAATAGRGNRDSVLESDVRQFPMSMHRENHGHGQGIGRPQAPIGLNPASASGVAAAGAGTGGAGTGGAGAGTGGADMSV